VSTVLAKRSRRVDRRNSVPKASMKFVLKLAAGCRLPAGYPAVFWRQLFDSPWLFFYIFPVYLFRQMGLIWDFLNRVARSRLKTLLPLLPLLSDKWHCVQDLLLLFSWLISTAHISASCSAPFAFCGLTISLCCTPATSKDARPLSFLSVHLLKRILSC